MNKCVCQREIVEGVELLAGHGCVPGVSCVSSLSTALSPWPGSLATSTPPVTRPHRTGSSGAGLERGEAGAGARHLHIVPAAARTPSRTSAQSPSCSRTASSQSPVCCEEFLHFNLFQNY